MKPIRQHDERSNSLKRLSAVMSKQDEVQQLHLLKGLFKTSS